MELEGLELLPEVECRRLLHETRVGRVAISVGEVPAVFPVNYVVAGDEILFFTGEGTKLRAAAAGATVTFEIDHMDPFARTGWSVMVVGAARERHEPAVIAGAERFGLRPWASGDRFHLVAVAIDFVSGRRIGRLIDMRDRPQLPSDREELPHAGEHAREHGGEHARRVDRPAAVGPRSRIGELAQRPVRISADSTLQVAADAMSAGRVSAVLAGADNAIVTERDLTRGLDAGLGPHDPVAAVWVTDLITVDEETTIVAAGAEMLRHEIRHLVVQNWRGEFVGLVSLREVLAVLVEAMDPAVWQLIQQTLSVTTDSGPDEPRRPVTPPRG